MKATMDSNSYIKIRLMKFMHYAMSIAIFYFFWKRFLISENVVVASRYNVFFVLFYALISYILSRIYSCYLIGYLRFSEVVFSQSITSFFSDAVSFIGITLIWNKLYNPTCFIFAAIVHILWNIIWTKAADKLFFKLYPPKRTVVLFQKKNNFVYKSVLSETNRLFDVKLEIEIQEEWSFNNVLEKVQGFDAIFVIGVNELIRNELVRYCVEKNISGYFLPHISDIIISGAQIVQGFDIPILNISRKGLTPEYVFLKRFFDFLCSFLSLIILSPVMLIFAFLIKLEDKGPVFYKQKRLTKAGRIFTIYKFRSMRLDAECDGVAVFATKNDNRITTIGKFMRDHRIDELPQLFNILKGDMSFVGPRPERPEIVDEYKKTIPDFDLRLQVKAGLTGYAQIYGKYNTNPYSKLEMDLLYINQMSVIKDLQILFATIKTLFLKNSAEGF